MAKNLPSNPEGAERVGFLHGSIQRVVSFVARQYAFKKADGSTAKDKKTGEDIKPAPGIVVVYEGVKTKQKTRDQFYANGARTDRQAAKDGSGFEPVEGGRAKHALAAGDQAHTLIQSIATAWPEDKKELLQACLADYRKFVGLVVELRSEFNRAGDRNYPVVERIVSLPKDLEDAAEPDGGDDDEEPTPKPKASKSDKHGDEAREIVKEILNERPYKKKGISLEDLGEQVGEAVKGTKNASAILALVQDEEWVSEQAEENHWGYDADEHLLTVE